MNNRSIMLLLILSTYLHGVKHSIKSALIGALAVSQAVSKHSLEKQYGALCTPQYELENCDALYVPQYTSTTFYDEEAPSCINICHQKHKSDEYNIKMHNSHITCNYKKTYSEECIEKINDTYLKTLENIAAATGIIMLSTTMCTCLCCISLIAN